MKKEELRPVQYKEFLRIEAEGDDFKPIYSDYQNGWFHGWEHKGHVMDAVIESESGSMISVEKSYFRFTDRD